MRLDMKGFLGVLALGLLSSPLVNSIPKPDLSIGGLRDLPKDVDGHHWAAPAVSSGHYLPRAVGRPRPRPQPPARPGPPNAPPGQGRPRNPAIDRGRCRRSPASDCPDEDPDEFNERWGSEEGDSWSEGSDAENPDMETLTRSEYQAKGQDRIRELDRKLGEFGKGNDPKDKDGIPDLKEGYRLVPETPRVIRLDDSDGGLLASGTIAKDLKLNPQTEFRGAWSQAFTGNRNDPDKTEYIGENYISGPGGEGVVICKNNRFRDDNNIAEKGKKHDWWSDHFVQLLKTFRGDAPIDDIKYVVRDSITAPGTQNMMAEAVRAMNFQRRDDGFQYGTLSYKTDSLVERQWFETMVGTVNAKGVARALQDYPNSFGRKKIQRNHLWLKQPSEVDWDDREELFEIALELGA